LTSTQHCRIKTIVHGSLVTVYFDVLGVRNSLGFCQFLPKESHPEIAKRRRLCEKLVMNAMELSLYRLLPLYFLVVLGFVFSKCLGDFRTAFAKILIYVLSPAVIFSGVVKADTSQNQLFVPLMIFLLCTSLCLIFLKIGGVFFNDTTKNILAFGAGNANSGYFAIPVGVGLFGSDVLPFLVLANFGFISYEYTVAYFVTARGRSSVKEALLKVSKLPAIYAFTLALILNFNKIKISPAVEELGLQFRGAYTVLGMMLIGCGVAGIKKFKFDLRYLSLAFFAKFICWPFFMYLMIQIDQNYLHIFPTQIYSQLMFLSSIPMAANTVAVATELNTEPEKAALAVLLSTLLAIISIPIVLGLAGF